MPGDFVRIERVVGYSELTRFFLWPQRRWRPSPS
jgi:hypothetical protein